MKLILPMYDVNEKLPESSDEIIIVGHDDGGKGIQIQPAVFKNGEFRYINYYNRVIQGVTHWSYPYAIVETL